MLVSVVIPTMKGREESLKKLISTIPDEYEKIIVDDEGMSLAAKRNKGARMSKGDHILFVDDDNYFAQNAIDYLMIGMDETIGVVAMVACYAKKKLKIADGGSFRLFITGFSFGIDTNCNIYDVEQRPYEVHEAANSFMIPRGIFEDSGGFDEENFPIDLDEADLCRRIRDMGYRIVYNPMAICYHDSVTYSCIPDFRRPMNAYFMGRNRILFQRKHLNLFIYLIFLVLFMPIFVGSYCLALLYRRKPMMILYFMKGVFDGLRNCKRHQYFKT